MVFHRNTVGLIVGLCLLFGGVGIKANSLPTVVSINLCTDQLVLLLAEPEQILSLSNLSHDSAGSYLYEQARQFPTSKGESESILALQPNLILAGQYTTRQTVQMLVEQGFRVETVPIANTFEQLFDNLTDVADWLGHSDKAVTLVARLRKRLVLQQQSLAAQSAINPTAAYYDPNGYTVGPKTLRGLSLELSGWTNLAAEWGIENYGSMPLESMVMLAPDALVDSPYSQGTYSRAQQVVQHPALRRKGLDPMVISIPGRQTICAGPWTVDMIDLLMEKRAQLLSGRK